MPDADLSEPVGSCMSCGANLYADDLGELCDQCLWWIQEQETDDAD